MAHYRKPVEWQPGDLGQVTGDWFILILSADLLAGEVCTIPRFTVLASPSKCNRPVEVMSLAVRYLDRNAKLVARKVP